MQNQQETANKEFNKKRFEDMIYFQNLVPGQRKSAFIDDFKKNCLDNDESKKYRSKLLENIPPTLSFKNKAEEDQFYKKQAESSNCTQFCCGGVLNPMTADGNNNAANEDRYKMSLGVGKLYEGTASDIRKEMKKDIVSLEKDSEAQQHLQTGLDEFNTFVEQRHAISMTTLTDTIKPFRAIDSLEIEVPSSNKETEQPGDMPDSENKDELEGPSH